ncbi:MAG: hypothetical protein ACRDSH_21305 [Pseudonocardiaceae bacterium]
MPAPSLSLRHRIHCRELDTIDFGRGTQVGAVEFADSGTAPIGPSEEGGAERAGIMGR